MSQNEVPSGLQLHSVLMLESCPHCGIAHPNIAMTDRDLGNWLITVDFSGNRQTWGIYACSTCGKVVVAQGEDVNGDVVEIYPTPKSLPTEIPDEPRRFLIEANICLHAPSAAILCAASSIDAMLKTKGYNTGNLYDRIEQAVTDNPVSKEMGEWAHHVRLEANDQRHTEPAAEPPTKEQAAQAVEFAEALAEFLFVLPKKVTQGLHEAQRLSVQTASASSATAPRLSRPDRLF
jgi:hypothetical protein